MSATIGPARRSVKPILAGLRAALAGLPEHCATPSDRMQKEGGRLPAPGARPRPSPSEPEAPFDPASLDALSDRAGPGSDRCGPADGRDLLPAESAASRSSRRADDG